jgi:hypothetical protein
MVSAILQQDHGGRLSARHGGDLTAPGRAFELGIALK